MYNNVSTQNKTQINDWVIKSVKFKTKDTTNPIEFVSKLYLDISNILWSILKLKSYNIVDRQIEKFWIKKNIPIEKIEKLKKSWSAKADFIDMVYSEKYKSFLELVKILLSSNEKISNADIIKIDLKRNWKTLVLINKWEGIDFLIEKFVTKTNDSKTIETILYKSKFKWSTIYEAVENIESIFDKKIWLKAKSNAWVVGISDLELAIEKIKKISNKDILLESQVDYNWNKYTVLDL